MLTSIRCRLIIGTWILLLPLLLPAQTPTTATLSAGSVSGLPGATVNIPLTVALLPQDSSNHNGPIDAITFSVTLTAQNGAPDISGVSFTPNSALSNASAIVTTGPSTPTIAGVFLTLGAPISGTVVIGQVQVTIPSSAVSGKASYAVVVSAISASINGNTAVNISPGPPGAVTLPSVPTIALSSSTLTFTAQQGAANPASQPVTISNSGSGTLNWSAASGAPWLSVSPASGTGTGSLSVSTNIAGLSPGTYTNAIQVTAAGAGNSPQAINVTLTVIGAPAVLALSATSVSFGAQPGGTNPAAQTVAVTNSGGGTLNWTAAVSSSAGTVSWLTVSPLSGTAPSTLTLTPNITGLAAGTYTASIQVSAASKGVSPQTINVTLTIAAAAAPLVALSTTTLTFSALQGGANPASQTVAISNSGTGTLNWTATAASSSGNWLSVLPSSGTAPATLTIATNITGLSAGTYTGTVQVSAGGAKNSPQTVNVTLTVTAVTPPVIALTPTALVFSAQLGDPNPPSQTAALTNTGGGTLAWTASVTNAASTAWLSVSPASGTGAATLTIAANLTGLAAGSYTGTIQVASAGASNTPQTLTVSLAVTQSSVAAIVLTPTAMQIVATAGKNPATQNVQVTNSFSGALGWTATSTTQSGGNWLAVSPSTGVTPSTLTATVTSASLAKGSYQGSITITALPSAHAQNSPQTVPVTLSVDAPVIGQNGIVSGASFSSGAGVSPGSIVSLFGSSLAATTEAAVTIPLPVALAGGTQVLVNGTPAPLFYVSPTQINFQMPVEFTGASAPVTVVSGGTSSLTATVATAPAAPGIFTVASSGAGQAAVLNQDSTLNSAANPAAAGSVIQIFATGLGATSPTVASGQPAPMSPLSYTPQVNWPSVSIRGFSSEVLFSGLAPGFVGLYQVNATVPQVPASSTASLQIQINGQVSNSTTIATR